MNEKDRKLDFNGLYANSDFQKLEQLLNRFNFFEAADIEGLEIKHTKFLGYLLDPNESHGLGSSFLQNFVWICSAQLPNFPEVDDLDLPYAVIQPERQVVHPSPAGSKPKQGEKGSLDVFIRIPGRQTAEPVVLAIENKINAKESQSKDGSQLKRYRTWLEQERRKIKEKRYYLYLTKRGDEPSDKAYWGAINYSEHIVPAIRYTLDQHSGKISAYIEQILKDYQQLFTDFSDSGEQDDCARKVCEIHRWVNDPRNKQEIQGSKGYVRHKAALELLMKYSDDRRYDLVKSFKQLASFQGNIVCKNNIIIHENFVLIPGYAMRPRFDFSVIKESLLKDASSLVDLENRSGIEAQAPFYFQVYFDKDLEEDSKYSCRYKLILGPMKEQALRQDLLNFLLEEFEGQKVNRRVSSTNWTTINATAVKTGVQNPQEWFEKNCFKPSYEENPDLSVKLAEWVVKANNALEKLMHKKQANALQQNP